MASARPAAFLFDLDGTRLDRASSLVAGWIKPIRWLILRQCDEALEQTADHVNREAVRR